MEILADTIRENIVYDEELINLAYNLYEKEEHQIRMVSVFLFGKLAYKNPDILNFLQSHVTSDESWQVQEILAKSFDNYCSDIGYENSLDIINSWLKSDIANSRRAVSEGLRVWTSKPYFKDNPSLAIKLLSLLKDDSSEYTRKSCGNALRDISKKYPEDILKEISKWGDSKEEIHIIKLIYKNKKLLDITENKN